jgi:hypothetical protein
VLPQLPFVCHFQFRGSLRWQRSLCFDPRHHRQLRPSRSSRAYPRAVTAPVCMPSGLLVELLPGVILGASTASRFERAFHKCTAQYQKVYDKEFECCRRCHPEVCAPCAVVVNQELQAAEQKFTRCVQLAWTNAFYDCYPPPTAAAIVSSLADSGLLSDGHRHGEHDGPLGSART